MLLPYLYQHTQVTWTRSQVFEHFSPQNCRTTRREEQIECYRETDQQLAATLHVILWAIHEQRHVLLIPELAQHYP